MVPTSKPPTAIRTGKRSTFLKNSSLPRNSLRKTAPSTPARKPSTTNHGNCVMLVNS